LARHSAGTPLGTGLLGTGRSGLAMDARFLGRGAARRSRLPTRSAGDSRSRPVERRAVGKSLLGSRLLDLARCTLCVARRLLVGRESRLGVGAALLFLDTARLCALRRLLGLARLTPRHLLRSRLLQLAGLRQRRLSLVAERLLRRWGAERSFVRPAELWPLLLRQLLRTVVRPQRHLLLGELPRTPRLLRSDLCPSALAPCESPP
jgi:hypothetical protein